MTENKGTARLRAIVQNQSDLGEREVVIPLEDAMKILHEVNDELGARVAKAEESAYEWREKYCVLSADLGMTDENPEHYQGDGVVSCSRAMRSMLAGWEMTRDGEGVPLECAYWALSALKYLWRFPLKARPREDLMKAIDCANKALDAWEE